MRKAIHTFLEDPQTPWAYLVQSVIFIMIIASVVFTAVELFFPAVALRYEMQLALAEYLILGIFTVEYLTRLLTATRKIRWARQPLSVIDFIAIFPSWIELLLPSFMQLTSIRGLRFLRLLRTARILRIFRLLRFTRELKSVIRYKGTILEAITPMIVFLVAIKSIIWLLEIHLFWIYDANLGQLFAIIGFALGIILSQKIASTYDKFLQVDETVVNIYGKLRTMRMVLDHAKPRLGSKICREWVTRFIYLLEHPKSNNHELEEINEKLYKTILGSKKSASELIGLHSEICSEASFCLSKKIRITPKAYDMLIHQSTMVYLILIAVFIPGATGLISVMVATYILYGMYYLTKDLDSICKGDFNLIQVNLSEIKQFAADLK